MTNDTHDFTPASPARQERPAPTTAPTTAAPPVPVSVVILTLDEEDNIGPCIQSCLPWCDDIHVLDSGSADRTREIASRLGAAVHVHKFESFGRQRNWAIDHIPCRHPWHFHLDADERFTPALVAEMRDALGPDGTRSDRPAYLCPSKMIFMGRWLKYAGGYPAYQVRLFHRDRCRFTDFGHGQREVCQGEVGRLTQPYIHLNFAKGLVHWFEKHNGYSSREAEEACHVRQSGRPSLRDLFAADPVARRRALKSFSYFFRGRSVIRFFDLYLRRGGFLDGTAGFHYSAMISTYEYWTELKVRERDARWEAATVDLAARLGADRPPAPAVPPAPRRARIDVLIPTLNEAVHITDAVRSGQLLGNVFVLDSLSTDGTQDLARRAGATVVEHRFVNYSLQKNWGLDNLPFTGDWVFILDADERITPDLRDHIFRTLTDPAAADGYFINRLLLIMGRAVRHGGLYPAWNLRLFRRGRARYEERSVHEHMVCQGTTAYMPGEMLHIRRESLRAYLDKHIRYADMESDEWVARKLGRSRNAPVERLFRHHLLLRQWLRRKAWPVMPWRPLWRLLYMYFLRTGFLDGKPGWDLARLMACYEYMISLFYRDKLHRIAENPALLARIEGQAHPTATDDPPQPATSSTSSHPG